MAASVRIEDEAFSDLRFRHLGNLLGTSEFDALGRMAHLWRACTSRQSYCLPRALVRTIVDPDALIAADLAEGDADLRIKGTEGRIEWLGEKRKAAQKGGDATRAKWRAVRPPQPKAKRRPNGTPNEGPPAPAPAPALKEPPIPPLSGKRGAAPLAAGPAASQPNGRQGRKKPKPSDPTAEEASAIERVLAKLSERSGREYRPTTVMHARRVLRLLRERSPDQTLQEREMDLRAVIWDRANEWAEDPKMDQFLRPSTVFGPEKFPDYLAQARAAWANRNGKRDERPRPGAMLDALAAAHAAGGEE